MYGFLCEKQQRTGVKERIWQMDYMKAICIFFVIITHYGLTYTEQIRNNIFWLLGINMAVPVFIIISGYMQGLSCDKNHIATIREYYSFSNIKRKLASIIYPFLIIYFIECMQFYRMNSLSIKFFLYGLFSGGYGPGSFYPLIMIQLILIFPILFFSIKKWPKQMLMVISAILLILEIISAVTHMNPELYRLLMIRYIGFVAAGIYLYLFDLPLRKVLIVAPVTILYLYMSVYEKCAFKGLFLGWERAALPELPIAVLIVILGLKYMRRQGTFIHKVILEIGQSTYFIFLIQMVWYQFAIDRHFVGVYMPLFCNIFLCTFLGCAFKELYSLLSKGVEKAL